jgi:large subunit ribosomal protein L35
LVACGRLYFRPASAITPPFRGPAKGLPWRRKKRSKPSSLIEHCSFVSTAGAATFLDVDAPARQKESQMPKLKTKSGAKKRFKITGTGKVLYQQSGKRHGMIKRSTKQIREHRGTKVLFKTDGDNIKKYWLPNS